MITFLFCLFIFLSGFSFLSVSPCLWLFLISTFTQFHFSHFIIFSPPSYCRLRSFLSFFFLAKDRFWKHHVWWAAELIAEQCVMQESRAACFPVTASDPKKHESLVDSWPAVGCWADTGWMWSGNRGIIRQFSCRAGQMYVMLLSRAVLPFLPVFRDHSIVASSTKKHLRWPERDWRSSRIIFSICCIFGVAAFLSLLAAWPAHCQDVQIRWGQQGHSWSCRTRVEPLRARCLSTDSNSHNEPGGESEERCLWDRWQQQNSYSLSTISQCEIIEHRKEKSL